MLRIRVITGLLFAAAVAFAAPPSRITRPFDQSRTAVVPGHVHRLAQAQYDRGAIDPSRKLNYMVLLVKPSAAQQTDLDQLLAAQQNPSSTNFRKWLSPEQFGARFGLNNSDQSKIVSWLTSQGFSIEHQARSANWIAFSGTAGQVSKSLRTPIHQFQVNGESHFANTAPPSVPEALADVVSGFIGLNDFHTTSNAIKAVADFTSGGTHYLAPADFATIYDVAPLYAAGIDGTGQSIAIVGESDVLLSDITKFRSTFGLPVNSPKMIPYSSTDPGLNGNQFEGNLDLEWAGAIAPKATLYYVYGPNAFTAIVAAIELNVAPVVSVSYSSCEVNADPLYFRSLAQQGNAQGITILAASGDAGAAGCDLQNSEPLATRGRSVNFPAVLPEVTGVGGTQFAEGSGSYWGASNSTTNGSAMSYIPEAAWNETASSGLLSTGGGASVIYSNPPWQTGPGVPNDNARHVPDVSFSAAIHDGYLVTYNASSYISGGTSASTPSMAGIVALLNQYQVTNKFQKVAGLGNINPQLYRLAQIAPSAFHDVAAGDNIVPCAQGSADCGSGSFGYPALAAYDQATGLGSVDANNLITMWNTAANGSVVTLTTSVAKATLNDTIELTAAVGPAAGTGTPTGTVNFVLDSIPLGSATLVAGSASVSVPLYRIGGVGSFSVAAEYSGDASFSSSGATRTISITVPTGGVTSIVPSAPTSVFPTQSEAQGLVWQAPITLNEEAGVPALITGLTIDGVAATVSQYFPSSAIPPKGLVKANFVFYRLNPPVTHTFVFTGTDPTGLIWSRQVAVNFLQAPTSGGFTVFATPLIAVRNPAAPSTCQWSVQLNLDDVGGYGNQIMTGLFVGNVDLSNQLPSIFGTTRLDAFGGLQGTICFSGITPPATNSIELAFAGGAVFAFDISLVSAPVNPGTLSASPSSLSLTGVNLPPGAGSAIKPTPVPLTVNLSDKTQSWTASIYPANRTTAWLSASQLSGTGPGTINFTANGAGFEPGVYRATIVIQSQNAVPQYVNVPVMFIVNGSTTTSIAAVANSASFKTAVSPGMLLSVFGTNLANSTVTSSGNPLPYSQDGVSATINGLAAPIVYASSGLLNIQVPYAVGSGPAVLGVNNNGQVAGFAFQVSSSSPGIFADANGNVVPQPVVTQGTGLALYVTGAGDVSPAIKTAYASSGTSNFPVPLQPVSVTVGGVPAFLQFVGITPGLIGVTQINVLIPDTAPTGNQPVVVTIGGNASAPANIVVQPK